MKQLRTVHTQTHTNIWQLLCQLLTHGLSVCLGTRPENTHTLYTVNCCSMGSNRKATGFSRKKHESLTQREWIDCLTENFKGGGGRKTGGWEQRSDKTEKKREKDFPLSKISLGLIPRTDVFTLQVSEPATAVNIYISSAEVQASVPRWQNTAGIQGLGDERSEVQDKSSVPSKRPWERKYSVRCGAEKTDCGSRPFV